MVSCLPFFRNNPRYIPLGGFMKHRLKTHMCIPVKGVVFEICCLPHASLSCSNIFFSFFKRWAVLTFYIACATRAILIRGSAMQWAGPLPSAPIQNILCASGIFPFSEYSWGKVQSREGTYWYLCWHTNSKHIPFSLPSTRFSFLLAISGKKEKIFWEQKQFKGSKTLTYRASSEEWKRVRAHAAWARHRRHTPGTFARHDVHANTPHTRIRTHIHAYTNM